MPRTIRSLQGGLLGLSTLCLEAADSSPASLSPPEVRINVVDAETGAAIPSFRVLKGVPVSEVPTWPSRKSHDSEIANWQPHLIETGEDGKYVWNLTRAWNKTALRIEADDYLPEIHTWIIKEQGSQDLEFRLKKDRGVEAKVLLPNGNPAPNTQVGVALIHREVQIVGTRINNAGMPMPASLRDRWQRPPVHETDQNGRCRLNTETDPTAMVVAVHPNGIAEMSWAEFAKTKVLRLEKWGRIKGSVTLGAKPGQDIEVTLGTQNKRHAHPGLISASMTTRTDADGRFAFEHVPPGTVQVSMFEFFPDLAEGTSFLPIPTPPGAFIHTDVKPGGVSRIKLGGKDTPDLRKVK